MSLRYLNGFLTMGSASSTTCQQHLITCLIKIRYPLSNRYAYVVKSPSTSLTFLGIVLDTFCMEIRLPYDKLQCNQNELLSWLRNKKNSVLVGLLQHATKVARCGKTFISRIYWIGAQVRELTFYKGNSAQTNTDWWHTFLEIWNGLDFLGYAGQEIH